MKVLYVAMLVMFSLLAKAEVSLIQEIDFGIIAIPNNNAPLSLTIDRFGNSSADPGFKIITEGNPGLFRVENMLPQVTYDIQLSVVNTLMVAAERTNETFNFEISDYDQRVTTDIDGNAIIRVGGKITTSGNGNTEYAQSSFTSRFNLVINQ